MKVVWLCHFANSEMKKLFNTPNVNEFAPWISNLIELLKKRDDIELHIAAPNIFINKDYYLFVDNVHYHFFKYRPVFVPKILFRILRIDEITNFYYNKVKIKKIVNQIDPEIIHLHGAENPYYSAGIFQFIGHYPVLVTIQGFIRNSVRRNSSINKRIKIEEGILCKFNHFGVRTKEMTEILQKINPNAQLHFHNYPLTIPNFIKNTSENELFDIIYFARISKDKGIEDLFEALALAKKTKIDISLKVIGSASRKYINYLKMRLKKLDINDNVEFVGFLEQQQDIFKFAMKAKICVLPTYHDIIPGTIIESMLIKLPVIAYNVGGIPELNKDVVAVILVQKKNIVQLAESILDLLNNSRKRAELAENAFLVANSKFKNDNVIIDILKAYSKVIKEYKEVNIKK